MCLHLIELLAGFRSHSKRIKMASKPESSNASILDDILPNFDTPTNKTKKKSTRKYSSEFEKILSKKLILPKSVYLNEKFTKLICSVNLSAKSIKTPRSILRTKRRMSNLVPMERTPKRVKLDISENSTEKTSRWNQDSTEQEDDSNDDDYNKSDGKKARKSHKKSNKKIKEEISQKKRVTRKMIKTNSSSDEEEETTTIKSPRKLVSPIIYKGVDSSDEDPVADNNFKKMRKRSQSIYLPENPSKIKEKKTPTKEIKESKKSNGKISKKTSEKPDISKKALTKTYGKKFFQCKVNLDCSSKDEEEEEGEEEQIEEEDENKSVNEEIQMIVKEEEEVEIVKPQTDEELTKPGPVNSSDDDSIFGDSKKPKEPVRRNSKSPSPFSKLLAESQKEKELPTKLDESNEEKELPPIVVTEDDLSQTGISEEIDETISDITNLNEIGLVSSNGDEKSASHYLNCLDSSQEDMNLSKTLFAAEVDQLISDLEPKEDS